MDEAASAAPQHAELCGICIASDIVRVLKVTGGVLSLTTLEKWPQSSQRASRSLCGFMLLCGLDSGDGPASAS